MTIILLLVPLSLIFLTIAIVFFFWAVKNDQYNDVESPAYRVIYDDQEMRKRERDEC